MPTVHTWTLKESSQENLATAIQALEQAGNTVFRVMDKYRGQGTTRLHIIAYQ